MNNIIEDTVNNIKKTADYFYQNNEVCGYQELMKAIDGITHTLDTISKENTYVKKEFNIEKINQSLNQALVALEQKDCTLVADILVYEIADVLTDITGE